MKSAAVLLCELAAFFGFIVLLATLFEAVMARVRNAVDVNVVRVADVGRAGGLLLLLERFDSLVAVLTFGVPLSAFLVRGTFRHSETLVKKLASAFP